MPAACQSLADEPSQLVARFPRAVPTALRRIEPGVYASSGLDDRDLRPLRWTGQLMSVGLVQTTRAD